VAIYRPPRPRWPLALAAALAGVAVGFAAGVLLSRSDPDSASLVAEVRSALSGAAGLLEVARVEYEESVVGREVANSSEYRGALGALRRSRARYATAAEVLRALNPAAAERIDRAYDGLASAMSAPAPSRLVGERLEALIELLSTATETPTRAAYDRPRATREA
jgi:hypothetical protein